MKAPNRQRIRWEELRVGDYVDMHPQGVMPVISREFDEQSGLWFMGFLHVGWKRIWKIAYIGSHEEEVTCRNKGMEQDFLARELLNRTLLTLDLRDLLNNQNISLYSVAKERDKLYQKDN